MKRLAWLIFLLFVITPAVMARAADVTATVDKTRVVGGESLTLTVTIDGGKGDVNVGGIRDFEVASRGTSSSYNIINGNVSHKTAYTFSLMPLKKGRLLIPPLPVTIGKKTVYTEMIPVEVSDSPAPGSRTGDAAADAGGDVFARLSVSDDEPYLGEQITCRLSLYTAVQIANAGVTKPPEFPGFSVEKLSDNRTGTTVIKGRRYNVTELVYVLTPEKTGAHDIGPAVISCDVLRQNTRRGRSLFDSFFDDPFFGGRSLEPRRLTAEAETVMVRPLPGYTGSDPFSGLVGEFAVAAEIDRTELSQGDSCNLAVIISGRGNIQAAMRPALDPPDAFKMYEDAPVEDIKVNESGVSGKKRFPAALVALAPGDYTLKPVSLTYFDVKRKEYVTISTAPIDLKVKAAPNKTAVEAAGNIGPQTGGLPLLSRKQAVEFTGKDIFSVKTDLSALKHQGPISPSIFAVLIGWPFLVYFLATLVVARLTRQLDDATVMARKARSAMKTARDDRGSAEERLDLLFKAVVYAVYARAGKKGESLTYREARRLLSDKGCPADLADEASRLLEKIEQARYGGQTVDNEFLKRILPSVRSVVRRIAS